MTRELTLAFPGRLETKTGGYAYDRRLIAGLGDLGWAVRPLSLGPGFPDPSAAQRREAQLRLSALPDGAPVIIDGLAFGVLDDWAAREAARLRIVALVHHPLALETGIGASRAERLRESERNALSFATHILVTSPATARALESGYGIGADKLTVALPGTDLALPKERCGTDPTPHILSVGTLTPRKGHDVLVAALKRIEDLDWRATIVGGRAFDPATACALEQQVAALDLCQRILLAGECEDTARFFSGADLFALASRYEGYGMVFAEALAHGVPIVACRAGAVPEVVPQDAGILVPVDDEAAFAAALRHLLCDADARRRYITGARRAGAALPRWPETARIVANCLGALS